MNNPKYIFSQGFDSFVYKTTTNIFNAKYIGELQLLGILERELGLSGEFKSNEERETEYLEVLSKYLKTNNTFISDSFYKDEIGVTKELLRWRDQLKFINWNFSDGISERLDLLAYLENNNSIPMGVSDRWLFVLEGIKSINSINIDSIEINDDLDLYHPFFKTLFNFLKEKGVEITSNKTEITVDNSNLSKIKNAIINGAKTTLDKGDNSFQILRFKDSIIASDFLADQLKSNSDFKPIIINRDNSDLDTSFLSYNLSLSGADLHSSNPQIIQVFKLVTSLLFDKTNPYNLLSLLNSPILPFPKKLAVKLSKALINNAGIGNEEWNETLESYKNSIENTPYKKQKLQVIELYLERERQEYVSTEDLIQLYRNLSSWAGKMIALGKTQSTRDQLTYLHKMSVNLVNTVIKLDKETFSSRELDKVINKIYEAVTININNKEKESHTVINSPSQLHNSPNSLIWFDFYNHSIVANYCEFLLQSEVQELEKEEGILLWSQDNQIQFQIQNLQKGITKADKKLYLIIPAEAKGTITTSHPLYANLTAYIKNLDDFIYDFSFEDIEIKGYDWVKSNISEIEPIQLPQQTNYINIEKSELLEKRVTESYSSIDNLIKYPLDWVLQYQAHITEKGLGNIQEFMTIKGNLSHLVVQTLLQKQKDGEVDLYKVDTDNEIDKLLNLLTPQYASPFNLDENIFEYKSFAVQLKKSFSTLLQIIKTNNLVYDSSEYEAKGKVDIIEVAGKIDLLFYKGNTPVIIDLKWTFSTKKYSKILEDEKSIQLATYTKLLGDKSAITAYYLLSAATLFTTSNQLNGQGVRVINLKEDATYVNDRISAKTINSYNYRWKEFDDGIIESAEDMSLDEIEYNDNVELANLIPLDEYKKTKKVNPYSSYGLFKGFVK